VTAFDDVDFYTDPDVASDPYPYFAYLRARCPVTEMAHHGVMAVTGYDELAAIDRDHERFSSCNALGGPFPGFSRRPEGDDIREFIAAHRDEMPMCEYAVTMDPPLHERQRGLMMRLLTPKRMAENEAFMWGLADRQIDEFLPPGATEGRVEVQREYGQPFAALVITDLLGVPEEDRLEFRRHLAGLPRTAASDPTEMPHDPLSFLQDTFARYVEDRRREPRDDVLGQLAVATYPDGSTPDVDSVVRMSTFLFAAGQDTTARLIASGLRVIAERPDIQAWLREDRSRIANFVEEALRHESVVKHKGRTAAVTTTMGGVEIRAGTTVALLPGAANRDPRRFEDPDEFRPDRPNANDHLSFGRGIHSCPGGPLARVEARVSFERFLDRTSHIAIDEEFHGPPDDRRFSYEPIFVLRGLRRLHLVLTPP
jgi:cytochrome P450